MKIKSNTKGFTLLELLVVVLIIGILAGIALPQYKIAVAKSKYSSLKEITHNIKESLERYYMIHNKNVSSEEDLDVTYKFRTTDKDNKALYLYFLKDKKCIVYVGTVACYDKIFGIELGYYVSRDSNTRKCLSFSTNKDDIGNKVCQQETGRQTGNTNPDGYISYFY